MKRQFFISGLGANERAFEKLDDFGTTKIMVKWIKNQEEESLLNYSKRLIRKYSITKNDIIVGLSFGGLIAQQIADVLQIKQVILISSFRNKNDLKPFFRVSLKLLLYKILPHTKTPVVSELVAFYLNSGSKKSIPILNQMLKSTDFELMKWSIQKIYEQNTTIGKNIKRINIIGTKDRIVNTWENKSTYKIVDGSHFMVYDKSEEISKIIKKYNFLE